jgi:hypothetical protein
LLRTAFNLEFTAENVLFDKNFSFVHIGSQSFVEIRLRPKAEAVSTIVPLKMQVVTEDQVLSAILKTNVLLNFTQALVLAELKEPCLVVF